MAISEFAALGSEGEASCFMPHVTTHMPCLLEPGLAP